MVSRFWSKEEKKLTGLAFDDFDLELDPTVTRSTELEEVGGVVVILKDNGRLNP